MTGLIMFGGGDCSDGEAAAEYSCAQKATAGAEGKSIRHSWNNPEEQLLGSQR